MQAQGVAAASVRGQVVPRLLSANAEHLAPRARPGPLDHVQYKEPWPGRPFRTPRGSWSFRLCGGLPRDVAVLGDRRPVLSCIAHLCEGIRAGRQIGRLSLCRTI